MKTLQECKELAIETIGNHKMIENIK